MRIQKKLIILRKALLHIVLVAGGLLMIFPFVWMIFASFKPSLEVISVEFRLLPETWTLANYKQVFDELPMARSYLNSLIVSSSITLIVLYLSAAAGYLFSKLYFRGRDLLFFLVLGSLMFPPQISVIALYFFVSKISLGNTYMGLILPFSMSAFGIFLMRQFIRGIPSSLMDAAKIDGATDFQIYRRIILPLTRSTFAVLGILTFIWSWDEFLWPLIIINQNEMKTLPVLLGHFTQA